MSKPATSQATRSATSSPASAAGHMQLDLLGGPTIDRSGRDRARASRSRSPAREPVSTTRGICGPTSFASSVPAGPLSSWESRLRDRLAMVGSTELSLIWRAKVTPAGASISRLAPWTPPTSGRGSTGSPWPTPCAQDGPKGGPSQGLDRLPGMAAHTPWPTPTAGDAVGTRRHGYMNDGRPRAATNQRRETLTGHSGTTLTDAAHLSPWPTPTAQNFDGGDPQKMWERREREKKKWKNGNGFGLTLGMLANAANVSTWATPMAHEARLGYQHRHEGAKGSQKSLTTQAVEALGLGKDQKATWPTPTSLTQPSETYNGAGNSAGLVAIRKLAMEPSGPTQSGSPGQTEKRGALNPAFPCWLMGYPAEWDACAPTATPSSRKSRLK